MPNYYDELEIEDFAWDPVARLFHYPCPCGDRFEISKGQLRDGEEIAICPSCSLIVRVIYDYLDWEDYVTSDEEDDAESVDTPPTETNPEDEQPAIETTIKAEEETEESRSNEKRDITGKKADPDIEQTIAGLSIQDQDAVKENEKKRGYSKK
ncbi:uncharacterized protein L201_004099 [Kwoniella dendrophila CBS 6074]|uniref:Diphthamide biosynthesis protein 3 n=1 Tax=Kwoniella dendrophila CBS 6074 TaxID=1295534 RepID=A0AAX4JVC0_9TREE